MEDLLLACMEQEVSGRSRRMKEFHLKMIWEEITGGSVGQEKWWLFLKRSFRMLKLGW